MSWSVPRRKWFWNTLVRPIPSFFNEAASHLPADLIFHVCHPHAVINQMDTSQAHLSSKAGSSVKDPSKPNDLSKDELHAVLKYGAQKM